MKAVVLAAGVGNRLMPLTATKPKPLMEVLGKPLLAHVLDKLEQAGVDEVFLNLHHQAREVEGFVSTQDRSMRITTRIEDTLTGPAGGAASFLDQLRDEPQVLVLSGDALFNLSLEALVAYHREKKAQLSVVTKVVSNPGRFGVAEIGTDGRIRAFREKPEVHATDHAPVSCGIYCVAPSILEDVPQGVVYDFGRHIIPQMARDGGAVYSYPTAQPWEDIGTPEQLRIANLAALRGEYGLDGQLDTDAPFVTEGAYVSPSAQVDGAVLVLGGAVVEAGARVIGPSVIGAGATVEVGAHVVRSLVLAGATVMKNSLLCDATLGAAEQGLERN